MAVLAAVFSLACIAASAWRLAIALAPTPLEPDLLRRALVDRPSLQRLSTRLAGQGGMTWDNDLLTGALAPEPEAREGSAAEGLLEFDWRMQRWARVPRVCASIATSSGFLCGSVALIGALADDPGEGTGQALLGALNSLAIGLAGGAFCVAAHVRSRTAARASRAAWGRLAEQLRVAGQRL